MTVKEGEWTTITLELATETPDNFVEPTESEILVRLYCDDAKDIEVRTSCCLSTSQPLPLPGKVQW